MTFHMTKDINSNVARAIYHVIYGVTYRAIDDATSAATWNVVLDVSWDAGFNTLNFTSDFATTSFLKKI